MALPAAVQYGLVTWTAVTAVADTADADAQPDAVPVAGKVTFTPSATVLLATGTTPVTVIATPVTYDLDTSGVLRDAQGNLGVMLVATDSPGITPTGWTWNVSYRLNPVAGQGVSRGSFSFALPSGSTVDLTTVAPVSSSNGVPIIQGPAGPPGPPGGGGLTASAVEDRIGTFPVAAYAQTGDADDTPAINRAVAAAVAAGGGIVQGAGRGHLYTVTPSTAQSYTTPSGTSTTVQVCVPIPSGVTVDMKGATVKLTGTTSAAVFANSNTTTSGTRNTDVGLRNVTVDGNGLTPTAGIVFLAYVTRPSMDNVRVTNGQYVGYNLFGIDHGTFGTLDVDNIIGQGFALGTPVGASNGVYDSAFGTLRARDLGQYNTGSQPGNSVAGSLTRCTISRIEARSCAAGVKLQGPGADVAVGTVFSYNTGLASGNSGLKLQGDSVNNWYPVRHLVDNVISINSGGQGLFLELCIDCTVGAYTGKSNNLLGGGADVWIGGTRDSVINIKTEASGGSGVIVRSYATDYNLGSVTVRNAGQVTSGSVGVDVPGGRGTIDNLVVIDDQATATTAKGFQVTSATAVLDIKKRRIVGPATPYTTTSGASLNLNDVASSPPFLLGGVRSGYYALLGNAVSTNNNSGVGSLRIYQVLFASAVTLTRIGAEITAAGDVGSKLRLGIYADDGNGMPGALILDAGTINGDSVGTQEITISEALAAGLYWVGGAVQAVTTTQPTVRTVSAPLLPQQIAATTIPTAAQVVVGASIGGVTGALPPTAAPSQLNAGSAPRIFVKYA